MPEQLSVNEANDRPKNIERIVGALPHGYEGLAEEIMTAAQTHTEKEWSGASSAETRSTILRLLGGIPYPYKGIGEDVADALGMTLPPNF